MVQIFHPLTELRLYFIVESMPQASSSWEEINNKEILADLACQAALASDWEQAAKINEKILKMVQNDVEAVNRLARALGCLGQTGKAQKLYKKALEIDPYNIIAKKNLDRIQKLDGQSGMVAVTNEHTGSINLSNLFVCEPGKTKVINLLNVASPSALALISCGDRVILNPKTHSISITSIQGVYLGALPDDLAHRMLSLITGGNQFEAYVKSTSTKSITVLVREVFRSPKFINQPSFQANAGTFFEDGES